MKAALPSSRSKLNNSLYKGVAGIGDSLSVSRLKGLTSYAGGGVERIS